MTILKKSGGNFGFQPPNGTYFVTFKGFVEGETEESTKFKNEKTGVAKTVTYMYWLLEVTAQIDGTPIVDPSEHKGVYRKRTSNAFGAGGGGRREAEAHKMAKSILRAAGKSLNDGDNLAEIEAQLTAAVGTKLWGEFGNEDGYDGKLLNLLTPVVGAAGTPAPTGKAEIPF